MTEHAPSAGTGDPDATHEATINWTRYWEATDETDRESVDADPTAEYTLDALVEFLDGRVESYADVGCGPGSAVFAVARRYPDATVVGYDAADPVLAANRERAREAGLSNAGFERAVLPAFDPGRQFDVVSCLFTLCYVEETERALQNLYEAVAPGGSLFLTYHNRLARSFHRRTAENPERLAASPFDPEQYEQRFELVLNGESLLSYERVHEALGTWPRSVWRHVDAERYGASRSIPLVYVPK